MRDKMLFLSAQIHCSEDHEGEDRTGGILGILQEKFDIDVLLYGNSHTEFGGSAISVHKVKRTITPRRFTLHSLYHVHNCSCLRNINRDLRGSIRDLCSRNEYSHVFISHNLLGNCIDLVRGLLPKAIIITDGYRFGRGLSSEKAARIKGGNTPYHKLNAALARLHEQRIMNKTSILLAASEWNALMFKALSFEDAGKVHVVPYFIDTNDYTHSEPVTKENWIVLNWNMQSTQGKKKAVSFYNNIYPLIKEKVPDIHCYIVGQQVHSDIVSLVNNDKSVTITGPSDSAEDYIQRAKALIAPMQEGCGGRSKILEAWALKTPVVTNSAGSEGLFCEHNRNILLANDTNGFAEEIVRLISDPVLGKIIADRAHQTLIQHYDANKIREKVLSLV
jgi:polysaccharide biosynthesis protein PslH